MPFRSRVRSKLIPKKSSGLAPGIKQAPPAREMPYSAEAEQHVIACCLLDGSDTIARSLEEGVTSASFVLPANQQLFGEIVELYRKGTSATVTLESLAQVLKDKRLLEAVGGFPYLMEVTGRIPTTAHAGYFIEKLREKELLREVIRQAQLALEQSYAYTGSSDGSVESLKKFATGLGLADIGGHVLPPVRKAVKFLAEDLPPLKSIVQGVFKQRYRLLISGGSKSFKTWILMDLALSVATGTPWWGMRTEAGGVLYVNFELQPQDAQERLKEIAKAKNLENPGALDFWDLLGEGRDIDELLPALEARAIRGQYSLIILDPIYVCLGSRDENSNSDVTDLMNRLARLGKRTGSAIAVGHHFSKGNQSEKDAKDRASGAGAWVRAPDTVITVTPHQEDDAFVVEYVLRGMKPKEKHVVRWQHPCMRIAADLDPGELKQAGRPKEFSVRDVVGLLAEDGSEYAEWLQLAQRRGISESTFKRLRLQALKDKLVEQTKAGIYTATAKGKGG